MFIRLTFKNDVMYINVEHIVGFKPRVDYSQIWLSDSDIIEVNESPDEILKLIEEAKHEKADY
jgi:hypothetical protein|nr:MAG TPA: Flagellar and Swarming motility protein [Caudoviricetes sp.]